jgi:hypothetical protein
VRKIVKIEVKMPTLNDKSRKRRERLPSITPGENLNAPATSRVASELKLDLLNGTLPEIKPRSKADNKLRRDADFPEPSTPRVEDVTKHMSGVEAMKASLQKPRTLDPIKLISPATSERSDISVGSIKRSVASDSDDNSVGSNVSSLSSGSNRIILDKLPTKGSVTEAMKSRSKVSQNTRLNANLQGHRESMSAGGKRGDGRSL